MTLHNEDAVTEDDTLLIKDSTSDLVSLGRVETLAKLESLLLDLSVTLSESDSDFVAPNPADAELLREEEMDFLTSDMSGFTSLYQFLHCFLSSSEIKTSSPGSRSGGMNLCLQGQISFFRVRGKGE